MAQTDNGRCGALQSATRGDPVRWTTISNRSRFNQNRVSRQFDVHTYSRFDCIDRSELCYFISVMLNSSRAEWREHSNNTFTPQGWCASYRPLSDTATLFKVPYARSLEDGLPVLASTTH